jgi:hypothetical protein
MRRTLVAQDENTTGREAREPVGREAADHTATEPAGAIHSHDDEHRGDFAEGQTDSHVPPDALPGDFAEGQEEHDRGGVSEHRGDFAEGQTGSHVPPDALRGDFAEVDEHEHSDDRR